METKTDDQAFSSATNTRANISYTAGSAAYIRASNTEMSEENNSHAVNSKAKKKGGLPTVEIQTG